MIFFRMEDHEGKNNQFQVTKTVLSFDHGIKYVYFGVLLDI